MHSEIVRECQLGAERAWTLGEFRTHRCAQEAPPNPSSLPLRVYVLEGKAVTSINQNINKTYSLGKYFKKKKKGERK